MARLRIAAAAAHFGRALPSGVERIDLIIRAARQAAVGLLVMPDASLAGYLADVSEPVPAAGPRAAGPGALAIKRLIAMAQDMVVCVGYSEESRGSRWNAAVCVGGEGVLGRYRRSHQPPGDAPVVPAADRFAAFDTPVGRMGMLIDYDKTFPEAAHALARDGARIIACLSARPASVAPRGGRLTHDRQARLFDLYDCARAAENHVVWVSANQTGTTGGLPFLGQAKVVGPRGEVLARTWAKAGLAVAELDVDAEIERARVFRTLG